MKHMSKVILFLLVIFISGCSQKYTGPNSKILEKFNFQDVSILLVVKVKSTEFTDYYPACKDCIPWSFWYVHTAKVIDVIYGDYEGNDIKFAMLQHADYIKEIKQEWYVHLKKLKTKTTKTYLTQNTI